MRVWTQIIWATRRYFERELTGIQMLNRAIRLIAERRSQYNHDDT